MLGLDAMHSILAYMFSSISFTWLQAVADTVKFSRFLYESLRLAVQVAELKAANICKAMRSDFFEQSVIV